MLVSGTDGRADTAVPPGPRRALSCSQGRHRRQDRAPPSRSWQEHGSGAGPACTGHKSSHRRPFTAMANSFLPVDAYPSGEAKQCIGWVSLEA
jgi:hypothetical protein